LGKKGPTDKNQKSYMGKGQVSMGREKTQARGKRRHTKGHEVETRGIRRDSINNRGKRGYPSFLT